MASVKLDKLKLQILSDGKVVETKSFDDPRAEFIEEMSKSSLTSARIPIQRDTTTWKWLLLFAFANCLVSYMYFKDTQVLAHTRISINKDGPIHSRRIEKFLRYAFARNPHKALCALIPVGEHGMWGIHIQGPVAKGPSGSFELHGECTAFVPSSRELGKKYVEFHHGDVPGGNQSDFIAAFRDEINSQKARELESLEGKTGENVPE